VNKNKCCVLSLGPNNTYTCCSPDQIANMADQFGMAKLMIGRCPSCYYNFRSIFCAMTCSTDHSRFVSVGSTGTSSRYPGQITVESVNYLMAADFGQRILDSCR
jgi:Niemann-Pick C1 protein